MMNNGNNRNEIVKKKILTYKLKNGKMPVKEKSRRECFIWIIINMDQ